MANITFKFFAVCLLLPAFAYSTKAVYTDDLSYTQLKSMSYNQLRDLKYRDHNKLSGVELDKYLNQAYLYNLLYYRAYCKYRKKHKLQNYTECLENTLDSLERELEIDVKCYKDLKCRKAEYFKDNKKTCKSKSSKGIVSYEKCIEDYITDVFL